MIPEPDRTRCHVAGQSLTRTAWASKVGGMHGVGEGEVSGSLGPEELAAVIERAQRLDPEAYDVLVDAYGQRLFGFLYRFTGSRDQAEDLLQEVFLRVVRTLPRYTHRGRFEGWLFRIAANLVRDRIRQARRTPTMISLSAGCDDPDDLDHVAGWDRSAAGEGAPDAPLIRQEQIDRMQVALDQLSAAEREVIMLRHYSERSFAEIAEMMGTPLGTALARAHRGLAKLRRIVEAEA